MVQLRSLQSSEKLPLIAQTRIPNAKYSKMSYKAPYLLLSNQSLAQIFLVTSSASSISLDPIFKFNNPGLDSDLVLYNVKNFL